MLKIDKKSYKEHYHIGYITIKKIDDYENIYSVNPLYLTIAYASAYIEEKGVDKYLVFNSTDENKDLLIKYSDVFNGIINKIKKKALMNATMKKSTQKLNLIQMIIYH